MKSKSEQTTPVTEAGKYKPRGNPFSIDFPRERELIVIASATAQLRSSRNGLASDAGLEVGSLSQILADEGVSLQPLFGVPESHLRAEAASLPASADVPDLSVYYRVQAPDEKLDDLAAKLLAHHLVEAAYVKPPGEPPTVSVAATRPEGINAMLPRDDDAPPISPDFNARQIYLNAAPAGIDARYASTIPGGRGANVNVIDCEWSWNFSHEDLLGNQGGVAVGAPGGDDNHGTAVQGEIGGDLNGFGIIGIAPDAFFRAASFATMPTAAVIRQAANLLRPGDIILLEIHRPGPRATGVGQQGYIAIEWWPDDYDAIRYATSRGVIVIEAAGNGAQNLDDPIYDVRPAGFPASWTNPFRRGARDSGATLVGAGAPPPGTHGRDWGPDRSRLDFSNYGGAIDAQGWGREVTSTGYGDLQGGANHNVWYTDMFSGTSSASPIVVGAVACVQGILRNNSRIPLSPARVRELLRATGSPQQDAPGRPATQRIGNRPNLRQLIASALQTSTFAGVQFTGTLQANQTARWFTFNWPAHWHVVWTVVPTTLKPGSPELRWKVQVERASDAYITYWINVTNTTAGPVTFEARYDVLGW
jgi:hypothetical protein